jgi:hypothetical protein
MTRALKHAAVALVCLTLPACASYRYQPPPSGACAWVQLGTKRRSTRYWLHGERVSRGRLEGDLSFGSPDLRAQVERARTYDTLVPALLVGGMAEIPFGVVPAILAHKPALAAISLVGVGAIVSALVLSQNNPLFDAVDAFNAKAARDGECPEPRADGWIP